MTNQWKSGTRYIVGIALVILVLYLVYLSRPILTVLVLAALIAMLVSPLIKLLHLKVKLPRQLAVFITYLIVAIILLLAPLILVPPIVDAVNFLLKLDYFALFSNAQQGMIAGLVNLKSEGLWILGIPINIDSVINPVLSLLINTGPIATPQMPAISTILTSIGQAFSVSYGIALNVVGGVFSGVVSFMFLILAAVYFSLDAQRIYAWFMHVVPQSSRPEFAILIQRLGGTWGAFFRGQVALMTIVGTAVWLGATIIGLPGALVLGLLAGLMEILPSLGPVLAAIPAVIVALVQGSTVLPVGNIVFALIVIGFYSLVNVLENTFIVPRVMGGAVKLHPLVVLSAVLVGTTVWGIMGALLAAPVVASGREIVYYLYNKVLGENPYPLEEEQLQQVEPSWWKQIETIGAKTSGRVFSPPESQPELPAENQLTEGASPEENLVPPGIGDSSA